MDLDYWQGIVNNRVLVALTLLCFTLPMIIGFIYIIRHWRKERKEVPKATFNRKKANILYKRIEGAIGTGVISLIGVIYIVILFVGIVALQMDVWTQLPTKQAEGVVTSELDILKSRVLIVIDGKPYVCAKDLSPTPLEKGQAYAFTYLQHSKEIISAKEILD